LFGILPFSLQLSPTSLLDSSILYTPPFKKKFNPGWGICLNYITYLTLYNSDFSAPGIRFQVVRFILY